MPRYLPPPAAYARRATEAGGSPSQPATVATRTACFSLPRLSLLLFLLQLASLVLTAVVPSQPWLLYASQNSPKRFTWNWQGCYAYDTGVNDETLRGCDPQLPSQLLLAALGFDAIALAGVVLLFAAACAEAQPRRGAVTLRALVALRLAGPPLARAMTLFRCAHLALLVAALASRDGATPPNAWSVRLRGFECLSAAVGASAASVVGWAALGSAEMWRHARFADLIGAEAARVRGVLSTRKAPSPPTVTRAVGGYGVSGAAARLAAAHARQPPPAQGRGASAPL